jgi:hypothetical protein
MSNFNRKKVQQNTILASREAKDIYNNAFLYLPDPDIILKT